LSRIHTPVRPAEDEQQHKRGMSMLNIAMQICRVYFLTQCKEHTFMLIITVHFSSMLENNNKNHFSPMTKAQTFYF